MTTDTEIRRGSPVRLSSTNIRDLALIELRRDGGTQSRVGNHEETVEEYAGAMREGRWQWHQGNALIAYGDDDGTYWLADGFHRSEAAARAGLGTVPCDVRSGSRRDAVLYAVGANSSHGLRRTRQDVRRAIELLVRDEEWGKWSNAEIARRVGCTDKTVAVVRSELEATSEIPRLDTRMGADGKARAVPVAPAAAPEAHPDPANAPLTDDEMYDLSVLGGFEGGGVPDLISAMGTRQITLTDTRNRAGWEPDRRTASAWRHELASLQVEAECKAAQAQKAARAEALIERAKGLGYEVRVLPSGKVVFHKNFIPYGGANDLDAAEARLDGIERANAGLAVYMAEREAEQREAHAPAPAAPAPAHPAEPRGVLLRHADELLAGLMQKLEPAELRLVNALAMHDVELDTDDEDVKAELWEHRHHFLHQLTDEELRWIEAGA